MVMIDGEPPRPIQLPATLHQLFVQAPIFHEMRLAQALAMVHNPSVAVHGGQLRAVVRVLSLRARTSQNVVGRIDDRWQLADQRLSQDMVAGPRHPCGMTHGYEDCRLVSWRGKLVASATVCDRIAGDGRPKIAVLEMTDAGDVVAAHVQPSNRHEKNWMPLLDDDKLRFVYSVDPSIVLDYDEDSRQVVPSPVDVVLRSGAIRGGSQLIAYGDGYLGVIHQVYSRLPSYQHRLLLLDKQLRLVRTSLPFFFKHHGIEFCAGLAQWQGKIVMSFGINDREAHLAVVEPSVVAGLLGVAAVEPGKLLGAP
jgi:predicted GH43/DUF377 family glycosyl hydrolase